MSAIDPDELKRQRLGRAAVWEAYAASLVQNEKTEAEATGSLTGRRVSIGGVSEMKIQNIEDKCDFLKSAGILHHPTGKSINSHLSKSKNVFMKSFKNP